MMKTEWLFVGIACAFVCGGCLPQSSAGKRAGDAFVVGFECGYVPYGYFDASAAAYRGYDLDLAQEVARRNNWRLELKPIDWSMKEALLNSGVIDCIWNGFKMDGRENQFEWSKPYLADACVVVPRTGLVVRAKADLAGRRIAVQSTTPNYGFLQPGGKWASIGTAAGSIVPVNDFVLLIAELREKNRCDAIITDYLAIQYWAHSHAAPFSNSAFVLARTQNAIAFKRGNRALRRQVQAALDAMVKDGTFDKITFSWFGLIPSRLGTISEGAVIE